MDGRAVKEGGEEGAGKKVAALCGEVKSLPLFASFDTTARLAARAGLNLTHVLAALTVITLQQFLIF